MGVGLGLGGDGFGRHLVARCRDAEVDALGAQEGQHDRRLDREVDVLRHIVGGVADQLRGDDADDVGAAVEQGTTAVAGLDRRRELVFAEVVVVAGQRADRADRDVALGGERSLQREADRDDGLAARDLGLGAEGGDRQVGVGVDAQEGEVVVGIGRDDRGGAQVLDPDLLAAVDDVLVGDDAAIGRDDEAGSRRDQVQGEGRPGAAGHRSARCRAAGAAGGVTA